MTKLLTSHAEIDFDGTSMPILHAYLSDASAGIRADAACAIGDRLRTHEIGELDVHVQKRLQHLLDDPTPFVRFEAAIALAEVHDQQATPLLLNAARLRDTRLDAIRALGTLGDTRAIPVLHKILGTWWYPWADRLQAASALCALRDAEGCAYVLSKVHSKKSAERAAAIHFMGETRHPNARNILESILTDSRDPMHDVAVQALGLLRDPAALPALRQMMATTHDTEMQDDIRQVIERLNTREMMCPSSCFSPSSPPARR